jgi:polysaccharide export outer membrane protein
MKSKFFIFILSALTSGIVLAQMSFSSGIDELIQMQSQSFGGQPPSASTSSQAPDPASFASQNQMPRLSSGDTVVLRFYLLESFINSGDIDTINETPNISEDEELSIYSSFGPITGLRSEYLQQNAANPERRAYLQSLLIELNNQNPFILDEQGILNLPGISPIPLQGLSVDEAALRIRSEPDLSGLVVGVTLIPVVGSTRDNLRLFGQDIFNNETASLSASRGLPANYIIGSGDQILVQLYGSTNYSNVYTVSDDGAINLPEIGPIYVIGVENTSLTDYIQQEISNSIVATSVSASVVSARPIEVFVAGEVNQPGAKVIQPFSTVLDAIRAAEGIKQTASIREIRLIRGSNIIDIDLYGFLIDGDSSSNLRVLPGDTVLINPAERIVGVSGEVRRQYYFELLDGDNYESLLRFAGGLTGNASNEDIYVERFGSTSAYTSIAISEVNGFRDQDIVRVSALSQSLENSVMILGPHQNEGIRPWQQGSRLLDIIGNRNLIEDGTDLNYALIKRQPLQNGEVHFLSSNLNVAFSDSESSENIEIYERDTIYLFNSSTSRQNQIESLLLESLASRNLSNLANEVIFDDILTINGAVNFSGRYPYTLEMTIQDLIEASGGLIEGADLSQIRILRRGSNQLNYEEEHLLVNFSTNSNFRLQPGDLVTISQLPLWSQPRTVSITGEVLRPGNYAVQSGESVYEAIERAGGLTERAFIEGIVFQRESLRQRERQAKEFLISQVQSQLTTLSVAVENGAEIIAGVQGLLAQYASTEPVGRLSFNDQSPIASQLRATATVNGDSIHIPEIQDSVSVFGEVRVPSSHIYSSEYRLNEYINAAGGFSLSADDTGVVIIKASGQVVPVRSGRLFSRGVELNPGDTILVPPDLNVNLQRNLTLVTDITQIIYQMAVAVAAVNSLGTN